MTPEQIEAAGKAAYEWDYCGDSAYTMPWDAADPGVQKWYRTIAERALAAAVSIHSEWRYAVEDESDDEYVSYDVRDTHSGRTMCTHRFLRAKS